MESAIVAAKRAAAVQVKRAEAAATRAVCAPAAEARPAVAPPRPQGPWACLAMTVHAMLGCELPT